MICRTILSMAFALTALAAVAAATSAQASVQISSNPTHNMNCSGGVCTPTAKNADLNATDLANMLASGDVKVVTGAGAVTITVSQSFSWTSTHRLTLDAYYNVSFRAPVVVAGQGAVTIVTNDGGTGGDLLFFDGGKLDFWDTASSLIINTNNYGLVKKLKELRAAIHANPSGFFALVADYNAQKDGVFAKAPIAVLDYAQTIEGLGHQIKNLGISTTSRKLLAFVKENHGTIRDLGLPHANISSPFFGGAGLAYDNWGTIRNCFVTGTVNTGGSYAGGIAGRNEAAGVVSRSHAAVNATSIYEVGGLIGLNLGVVEVSYATGSVDDGTYSGGLVGLNRGIISQSFASGSVNGHIGGSLVELNGENPEAEAIIENSYATGSINGYLGAGGLAGENEDVIQSSYSTASVTSTTYLPGGLVGLADNDSNSDTYWNLDTSGVSNPAQGAGNIQNDPGITGLTDAQLKSNLPAGFDPKIWGQNPDINNGYPYLLANPPPQ